MGKKSRIVFDNNQVLHAAIEEREPLARIFTLNGILIISTAVVSVCH